MPGDFSFFLESLARNRKDFKIYILSCILDIYGEIYLSLHFAKTENHE